MFETMLTAFLAIFATIAMIVGLIGFCLGLYHWIAGDLFGKPIKVNGVTKQIDWPTRRLLALFTFGFASIAAAGVWMKSNGFPIDTVVTIISSIPLWAYLLFFTLLGIGITSFLSFSAGWHELIRAYGRPTQEARFEQRLRWASMGDGVSYRNVLHLSAYDNGIGLRQSRFFGLFTRPVLVPWDEVRMAPVDGAKDELILLQFGNLSKPKLLLPEECWSNVERHRRKAW